MLEPISALFGALKSATPYLLAGVALSSAFVLWAPSGWLEELGLIQIATAFRGYFGGALILSSAVLVAQGARAVGGIIRSIYGSRANARRAQEVAASRVQSLHELTAAEQTYLAMFVLGGQTSVTFPVQDGVAGGLRAKRIIYQSASVGDLISGFAHNLQPWAREYLTAHPELLARADERHLPKRGLW